MSYRHGHPRSLGALFATSLAALTLVSPSVARADWPMARHDARRTGLAPGKSDIKQPVPRWRSYLGGSIRQDGLLTYDIDKDGRAEILHSTGGAIAAKRPDDTVIWRRRIYGSGILLDIADLDGDGKDELVAYTTHNVYVLDVITGEVRWAQPDGEMGVIAPYVRIVDLNGDKRLDLIIPECGGCGGSKQNTAGVLYSFAAGYTSPTRIPLPVEVGVTSVLTAADVNGSGLAKILINDDDKNNNPPSSSKLTLLDGATGAIAVPAPFDTHENSAFVTCVPGDIDGVAGEEFVCLVSPGQAGDRLFALRWSGAIPSLVWNYKAGPGEVFNNVLTDPLVDLDVNGTLEVAVSKSHADGSYSTSILRADTGAEVASYAGQRYVGYAALGPSKQRTLITNNETEMSGFSFDGKSLIKLFTIPDQRPTLEPNRAHMTRSSASALAVVTSDLSGDGVADLITWKLTGPTVISGYSVASGPPALLASLSFSVEVSPTTVWALPPVDQAFPQVAIAQTDGVLRTLDKQLQPTSSAIRYGGYYAAGGWGQLGQTGVVASLDGGAAQQILFTDSKGALRRIDAKHANQDTPPITTWEVRGASHATIVPGMDGGLPGIATFASLPPPSKDRTVRLLRASNGEALWEVPIPETPINDLVAGRFTLGGTLGLVFQTADPAQPTLLRTRGISGESGASLWSFSEKPGNCGLQPAGVSVADWNGDGYDDVLQQAVFTRANSGADGASVVVGTVGGCYFLPAIVDANNDGEDEVILQGGFESINMLTHNLSQQVFASNDGDRPYPYGALAQCPGGPVWVEGSWQFASRLKITKLSAPDLGSSISMFLASGARYPDEESVLAAHAGQGQLTAVSVHANLAGDGVPVAVVGSGDGFLYGVEPCSGALRFALDFAYSVGEPLFGDTDGDGLDEIIVSVADGNLYALVDEPAEPGTGGSGGTDTVRRPTDWPMLYGRADCYCQAPGGDLGGAIPGALFALCAALAGARRRPSRQGQLRLSPWQK